MSGDVIFGYRYQNTIHYISRHINDGSISDYESLIVSVGDRRREYRYQDTSFSSSLNRVFYHSYD